MNDTFKRPFTLDRVVRLVITMLIAAAVFFLLSKLSGVLLPFLIAWMVAYMIYPLVKFYQYRCRLKNRVISILCALLSVMLVCSMLLYFIVPSIIDEIVRASGLISNYITHLQNIDYLSPELKAGIIAWFDKIDMNELFNQRNIKDTLSSVLPHFWGFVSGSIEFIISLFVVFIIFLYIIFILADYEHFSKDFQNLIPEKWRHLVAQIVEDLECGMNRYFRGQALIALVNGVLFSVGFYIIGLPLGIVLGLFMGVLTMIPYMQLVGYVPALFLAILQTAETGQSFGSIAIGIIIIALVVQVLQDIVLTPKIMGKATGMGPAAILLSISIWGALLGILGMIIALPLTTIIVSYYKRFIIGNESVSALTDKDCEDKE